MIKEELLDLINNLENVDGQSIAKLDELKKDHPYFQAIPILQAKIANDSSYEDKKNYISRAAIYTADRKNLKDLIENQKAISKVKSENEPEKTVQAETISQNKPATSPSEVEKPLKEAVEEEKAKVYAESATSSNELYDEVMKNLATLRSLRQQYDFLEEKIENEEEKEEEVKDKKETKVGRPPKKSTTTKSSKAGTKKKTTSTKSKPQTKKETPTQELKDQDEQNSDVEKTEVKSSIEQEFSPIKKIDLSEQNSIIDSFIKNEPQITRKQPDETVVNKNDLSENSTKITDELVSENLADIMLSQGKTDKAIEIYKKLIWKFPQKKAYFASRIEELTKK